jgi:pyruvate kinase
MVVTMNIKTASTVFVRRQRQLDNLLQFLSIYKVPRFSLARFANGPHELERGDIFTITVDEVEGTKERVGTTYKGLPGDCKPGDRILIDDGKVTVEVVEVKGNDVVTKVIQPGAVSNNKGINLPGVAVSVPALSEKDKEDLRWGLQSWC